MYNTALLKVCHRMGGQSVLARLLEISPSRVNKWLNQGVRIPYEYALAIEQLTEGQVTCQMLTPYCEVLLCSPRNMSERLSWLESQVKIIQERLNESSLSCRHRTCENTSVDEMINCSNKIFEMNDEAQ